MAPPCGGQHIPLGIVLSLESYSHRDVANDDGLDPYPVARRRGLRFAGGAAFAGRVEEGREEDQAGVAGA